MRDRMELAHSLPLIALVTMIEDDHPLASEEAPVIFVWDEVSPQPLREGFITGGSFQSSTGLQGHEAGREDHFAPRKCQDYLLSNRSSGRDSLFVVWYIDGDMADCDSFGCNFLEKEEIEVQPVLDTPRPEAEIVVRVEYSLTEPLVVLCELRSHFKQDSAVVDLLSRRYQPRRGWTIGRRDDWTSAHAVMQTVVVRGFDWIFMV